jgi:hypothetical protein
MRNRFYHAFYKCKILIILRKATKTSGTQDC